MQCCPDLSDHVFAFLQESGLLRQDHRLSCDFHVRSRKNQTTANLTTKDESKMPTTCFSDLKTFPLSGIAGSKLNLSLREADQQTGEARVDVSAMLGVRASNNTKIHSICAGCEEKLVRFLCSLGVRGLCK